MRTSPAPRARPCRRSVRTTRLRVPGAAPQRVLAIADRDVLFGTGPDGGIADDLCAALAARSPLGLDLDLLHDVGPAVRLLARGADDWRLLRWDAVVLVERQAGTSAGHLRSRAGDVLRTLFAGSGTVFAEHGAGSGWSWGDAAGILAERIADDLAVRLNGRSGASPTRAAARAAEARQRAADRFTLRSPVLLRRLGHLARIAQDAFQTESAVVNLLDDDGQHTVAAAGGSLGTRPVAEGICHRTVAAGALTVFPDTRDDPELRQLAVARGPNAVRFYAGCPVDGADGEPVGALCVYDSRPRDPAEWDFDLLRDLALLVEAEIVEHAVRA